MALHEDIPLGALISLLHRYHFVALNTRLKPLGLTAGQFPILLFLSKREGIPQETLARHFHFDKATIARAVRRLEDDGFLCRKADPGNRRAYGLFLTEKGRQILPDILRTDSRWEEELLAVLPENARSVFLGNLRTIAEQSTYIAGCVHDDECPLLHRKPAP